MRIGLFLSPQWPAGRDPVAGLGDLLDQVRAAREAGYAAVMAPHHVLAEPYQMLQPLPLLARVAAESGDMRVATGVLLVTLLNPVEVAESIATLDVITGGRAVLGAGLGYRAVEDAAFGVPPRRIRVMLDKLAVVRDLLEGRAVTAEGPGYRLDGARLALRPVRAPRPPLWLAGNDDRAVRRAARHGDAWLLNPHAVVDDLARQMGIVRAERGGAPPEVPVVREVCVAPTDAEALHAAAEHLVPKYRAYVDWGQDAVMPAGDTLRREWNALHPGRFLVGAPETVRAGLTDLRDRVGATLVLARVAWPGSDPAVALRSIRLLAEAAAGL